MNLQRFGRVQWYDNFEEYEGGWRHSVSPFFIPYRFSVIVIERGKEGKEWNGKDREKR